MKRNGYRLLKRICASALLAIVLIASLGSCRGSMKTVMKIGGMKVRYVELRYFVNNFKRDLEGDDPDIWEKQPELLQTLEAETLEALKRRYAVLELADEYKVALDKDERESLDETVSEARDTYDFEEYFMTEELFRGMIEYSTIAEKLCVQLTDEYTGIFFAPDDVLLADIPENFVRVTQILITTNGLSEAEKAVNRELAEQLLERANSGEDFNELVDKYSADMYVVGKPDGRCFTRGELLEPFEKAAFALEEGAISGIVETVEGYHIIKRLPITEEYIDEHIEELREAYKLRKYNELIDQTAAEIEVEYTDYYHELDLLDLALIN